MQKCDRYTRSNFKTRVIVTILRQLRSNAPVTGVTVIILRQIEIRFFQPGEKMWYPAKGNLLFLQL